MRGTGTGRRPDGGRPASPEDDSLGELFWSVGRRLRHLSKGALEPLGLNPSHSRALVTLMRHGPIRLSQLSEHLRIAPRSATEVVDALEERGLVARHPDPADRRATLVEVTDAGTEMGVQLRKARAAETDAVFASLSAADRDRLRVILHQLLDD